MPSKTFMDKYPTKEEIIKDENNRLTKSDLVEIAQKPILGSRSTSWRDTTLEEASIKEETSIKEAILETFKISNSELNKYEIIQIGKISSRSSSFAQCSTYEYLYLVLDKEKKTGYYLVHKNTDMDEYLYR